MGNIARKLVTLFFAICTGFAEVLVDIFNLKKVEQERKQAERTRSYIESQPLEERAGRLIPCAPESGMLDEIFNLSAVKEGQNQTPAYVENDEPEVRAARLVCWKQKYIRIYRFVFPAGNGNRKHSKKRLPVR